MFFRENCEPHVFGLIPESSFSQKLWKILSGKISPANRLRDAVARAFEVARERDDSSALNFACKLLCWPRVV